MLKQDIKKLKGILKVAQNTNAVHDIMEQLYIRITNRKDNLYTGQFSTEKVFSNKQIKRIGRYITKETAVVFEIVEYTNAPNGYVIIYNDFKNEHQVNIDFYITKEYNNE